MTPKIYRKIIEMHMKNIILFLRFRCIHLKSSKNLKGPSDHCKSPPHARPSLLAGVIRVQAGPGLRRSPNTHRLRTRGSRLRGLNTSPPSHRIVHTSTQGLIVSKGKVKVFGVDIGKLIDKNIVNNISEKKIIYKHNNFNI